MEEHQTFRPLSQTKLTVDLCGELNHDDLTNNHCYPRVKLSFKHQDIYRTALLFNTITTQMIEDYQMFDARIVRSDQFALTLCSYPSLPIATYHSFYEPLLIYLFRFLHLCLSLFLFLSISLSLSSSVLLCLRFCLYLGLCSLLSLLILKKTRLSLLHK